MFFVFSMEFFEILGPNFGLGMGLDMVVGGPVGIEIEIIAYLAKSILSIDISLKWIWFFEMSQMRFLIFGFFD